MDPSPSLFVYPSVSLFNLIRITPIPVAVAACGGAWVVGR